MIRAAQRVRSVMMNLMRVPAISIYVRIMEIRIFDFDASVNTYAKVTMEVGQGENGMEIVTLRAAGESKAVIYSFGAHVTSWCDSAGFEKIYTSPTAIYNGIKAVRGGIPVCFPQFGKYGDLKQHGFARNMTWSIDTAYSGTGPSSARFVLNDTEETRASAWPHAFELSLIVSLAPDGNKLTLDLAVENKQSTAFTFTIALHSYFSCESETVKLSDYDSVKYIDAIDEGKEKVQSGDISFGKEVDRVYMKTPDELNIEQSCLKIMKSNYPEAVVWNPYIEKTAALKDMPDDGYKNFICIEPARVMEPAQVAPGEKWTSSLVLSSVAN